MENARSLDLWYIIHTQNPNNFIKIEIYPSFFQCTSFSDWHWIPFSTIEKGKGDFCGNGNGKAVSNRHEMVSWYDAVSQTGRIKFCNRSAWRAKYSGACRCHGYYSLQHLWTSEFCVSSMSKPQDKSWLLPPWVRSRYRFKAAFIFLAYLFGAKNYLITFKKRTSRLLTTKAVIKAPLNFDICYNTVLFEDGRSYII